MCERERERAVVVVGGWRGGQEVRGGRLILRARVHVFVLVLNRRHTAREGEAGRQGGKGGPPPLPSRAARGEGRTGSAGIGRARAGPRPSLYAVDAFSAFSFSAEGADASIVASSSRAASAAASAAELTAACASTSLFWGSAPALITVRLSVYPRRKSTL